MCQNLIRKFHQRVPSCSADKKNMQTEFPRRETFPESGMHSFFNSTSLSFSVFSLSVYYFQPFQKNLILVDMSILKIQKQLSGGAL